MIMALLIFLVGAMVWALARVMDIERKNWMTALLMLFATLISLFGILAWALVRFMDTE